MAFKTQQGIFSYGWQTLALVALAPAAAQTAMEILTLKMVSDWMDNTGRHATRLTWWLGTAPNTMLYTTRIPPSLHAHDRFDQRRARRQAAEE